MPELPELEVVREVLEVRAQGQTISNAVLVPPGGAIVARDLTHNGFEAGLAGAHIDRVSRRGKFLVFALTSASGSLFLAVNPKLTGRLQLAEAAAKRMPRTHLVLDLDDGQQLRYVDQKQMGQLYLTQDLESVPEFSDMGPEALEIELLEFRQRLRTFSGEIKGIPDARRIRGWHRECLCR